MIIVDSKLERRQQNGNFVRVAMVGAGYIGRGVALQIEQYMTGMRLVAIANRTLSAAKKQGTMPLPMMRCCYVKLKVSTLS